MLFMYQNNQTNEPRATRHPALEHLKLPYGPGSREATGRRVVIPFRRWPSVVRFFRGLVVVFCGEFFDC